MDNHGRVIEVPWERICPMPGQPRSYFDAGALAELATSIKAIGQVVPVHVAPAIEDRHRHDYQLIDGQRRWHAAQIAGVPRLRCLVVDEPDEDRRYLLAVVANLARQAHQPMEIAVACDRLRRTMTIPRVAAAIGRSNDYVSKYLTLLRLAPSLQEHLFPGRDKNRKLPLSAAFRLAQLEHHQQLELWEKMKAAPTSPNTTLNRYLPPTEIDPASRNSHASHARTHTRKGLLTYVANVVAALEVRYTPDRVAVAMKGRSPAERRELARSLRTLAERAVQVAEALEESDADA